MALVAVPGGLWLPNFADTATVPAFTSIVLDAAADRIGVVFRAPKTGNIRKVGFRTGAVTIGVDTTLTFSLQDVDVATGYPDDTDDQTATIATGSIAATSMILSGNLSADRAVTVGDWVGAVVKYGTFNASDSVAICMWAGYHDQNLTTVVNNLTGSYAKPNTVAGVVEIQYDDGSYGFIPNTFPYSASSYDDFANDHTPDEIGLQFQVPFPCTLAGCWIMGDMDGDFQVNLYTAAAKTTLGVYDKDIRKINVAIRQSLWFPTTIDLAANTTYVLSIEPTSTTHCRLYNVAVRHADVFNQLHGGPTWLYASDKDPAVSTDFATTALTRPEMGLILSKVDDGVQVGGGGRPELRGANL